MNPDKMQRFGEITPDAAEQAIATRPAEFLQFLRANLAKLKPYELCNAAEVVGSMPDSIELLQSFLKHSDPAVRGSAVMALTQFPRRAKAASLLKGLLKSEPSADIRMVAEEFLAEAPRRGTEDPS